MEFMKSSLDKLVKNLSEENFKFFSLTKKGKIDDDGKKSVGQISFKDYLTCEKTWDKCHMKNMGDYRHHYLRKDVLLLADVLKSLLTRA